MLEPNCLAELLYQWAVVENPSVASAVPTAGTLRQAVKRPAARRPAVRVQGLEKQVAMEAVAMEAVAMEAVGMLFC